MNSPGPISARIDGRTKLYGILGDPIEFTQTPQAINERVLLRSKHAVLVPFHVPATAFEPVIGGLMGLHNLYGLAVTYPFKAVAASTAHRLSPAAQMVGAVNVLRREAGGTWTGDILDGQGLVRGLREAGADPARMKVLLVGVGGAGGASAIALAEADAGALDLIDLDQGRAIHLASLIRRHWPECDVVPEARSSVYDIIVNCSPVGLKDDDPLSYELSSLDHADLVVDIVPRADTPLLKSAASLGWRTLDYRTMSSFQADKMMEFWGM